MPVSDSQSDENALQRAAALRVRLRQTLADVQREVRRAEENNLQLHQQLERMKASAARRTLVSTRLGVRRIARAIQHPFWTAGTVMRGLVSSALPKTTLRAYGYLRRRTFPLRLTSPIHRAAQGANESLAIRWIGPVNLRHTTFEALLCHAPASVEYAVTVPAGSRFVCGIALSPQVWENDPPRVEFRIAVRVPAAPDWQRDIVFTVDPGRRWTHRRWHLVSIPVPNLEGPAIDVEVELSTRLPDGESVENAWALFGEPRFEWPRNRTEIRRSMQTFVSRARTHGLRSSFELLRTAGISIEDRDTYIRWVAKHTRTDAQLAELAAEVSALPIQPLISLITPVYNTDPRWLRACIESVRRQVYPNWQLCLCDDASSSPETVRVLREYETDQRIRIHFATLNGGISLASNHALDRARGDFVAFLDHDDELPPDALAEVVRHINLRPDVDVIYSDEDKLDLQGARCDPYFKPDWSPEHFLACMYTCHLMVVRRQLVVDVGGFRAGYEGAQDYDLLLRVMERTRRIGHIPRVLYHWRKLPESTASAGVAKPWALDAGRAALEDYVRRSAVDAEVVPGGAPGVYRVRHGIVDRPLVSIIIPTAGRLREVGGRTVDVLANAIRSIVQQTSYENYELVIVADRDGLPETTRRALDGTRHEVLRFERFGLFNFSAKINAGAAAARGDHLLLFNDDLEVISGEWLTAMLEYSQLPAIGAVGAKLLYPDGRLQHIGIVLGVAGIAAHAFHQHPGVSQGYGGSAIMVRNYAAVTAACLMTRRQAFEHVGRFDERFPIDFNDVDYCLRLQRAGYRVVFTPFAQLYHHESASFGTRQHDLGAMTEMRSRWGAIIDRDPYYNPNLTRDFPDYRLDA
jgi:GT2 family glycosyltransferase